MGRIDKRFFVSYLEFTDGSVAARLNEQSPWLVVCGPDGMEADFSATSSASIFASIQNKANKLVYANAVRGEEPNHV